MRLSDHIIEIVIVAVVVYIVAFISFNEHADFAFAKNGFGRHAGVASPYFQYTCVERAP